MPADQSVGLRYNPIYDFSGGMSTNYNFTRVKRNQMKYALNGVLTTDGSYEKRRGRTKLYDPAITGNPIINSLHTLGQATNADLIFAGTSAGELYEVSTGTPALLQTGLFAGAYLASTNLDNFAFFCNGVDKPFMTQGTAVTTYDVGIVPVTAVQFAGFTVTPSAGGDGTIGTHQLTMRYRSSITGARSNPYIVGEDIQYTTVALVLGTQTYDVNIAAAAVSADPQVDFIDVFVQFAGVTDPAAPAYFLGTVPNAVGVTSFGTDVSDDLLGLGEVIDIDDNQPLVTMRDIEAWRGRLLGIIDDYHVRYSKSRFDANTFVNLPTSWPMTNDLEVGFGDGDPLIKVVIFNDYVFAFKRRSIWMLMGDFDSPGFGFKRLKTNYANAGLINQKSVVQAGERVFFVSDDLKFYWFAPTDFDTTQIRLSSPPGSEDIANLFTNMTSQFRDFVNVTNFNFAQHTQVQINFADGLSGFTATENFNSFVYDYTVNGGQGGWTINSQVEAASSVLARDNTRNYFVYTGDYYGFVWKNSQGDGDGAEINGTSSSSTTSYQIDLVGIVGTYQVGETVSGSISLATGTVTFVGTTHIDVELDNPAVNFVTAEVITGLTSGATGTSTAVIGGQNYNELVHGAVVGGPFIVGETVIGTPSNAQGVVIFVGVGFIRVINVDQNTSASFQVGDTLTGQTSLATTTMTDGFGVLKDVNKTFTSVLIGVFASILEGTGADQVRRITSVPDSVTVGVQPMWSFIPDNTSEYTIGGIDFMLWGRDDWQDDQAPPDFDKYGWFVDIDVEGSGASDPNNIGSLSVSVELLRDRSLQPSVTRVLILDSAALWGIAIWGFDLWGGQAVNYKTVGFDLLFRQLSVRIRNRLAGQFIKVNGYTVCYQDLEHVRR